MIFAIGHTLRTHEALGSPYALSGLLEVVHRLSEDGVFVGHDKSIRALSILRRVDGPGSYRVPAFLSSRLLVVRGRLLQLGQESAGFQDSDFPDAGRKVVGVRGHDVVRLLLYGGNHNV